MLHLWKLVLLFVVLTPGIVLTLPPVVKNLFGSGKSSLVAAGVHAVIFVVLMNLFSVDGFAVYKGPPLSNAVNKYVAPPPPLESGKWSEQTNAKYEEAINLYTSMDHIRNLMQENNQAMDDYITNLDKTDTKYASMKDNLNELEHKYNANRENYVKSRDELDSSMQNDLNALPSIDFPKDSKGNAITKNARIVCKKLLGFVYSTTDGINITISFGPDGRGAKYSYPASACTLYTAPKVVFPVKQPIQKVPFYVVQR